MEVTPGLHQVAELDFDVLGFGHGAPITTGAAEKVRALVRSISLE